MLTQDAISQDPREFATVGIGAAIAEGALKRA
jgi:hypothetical protein